MRVAPFDVRNSTFERPDGSARGEVGRTGAAASSSRAASVEGPSGSRSSSLQSRVWRYARHLKKSRYCSRAIRSSPQRASSSAAARGRPRGAHLEPVGLGQVLEPVRGRVGDEVGEQQRCVLGFEVVVVDDGVASAEHSLGVGGGEAPIGIVARDPLSQHREHLPGGGDALLGPFELARVEPHRVPGHRPQAAARQRVVADVCHAVPLEHSAAQREQPVAHRLGDPRVHAVRDHVVEAAQLAGIKGGQIRLGEGHVCRAEASSPVASDRERLGIEVQADELATGQGRRHRDEIAAVAAAQLEHPAALGRGRLHAHQPCVGGEPVGVALGEREPRDTAPRRRRRGSGPRVERRARGACAGGLGAGRRASSNKRWRDARLGHRVGSGQ